MDSTDESYSNTGYEPEDYNFMETYVESLTEPLTKQQFPVQRFLEDMDFDDAAIGVMLFNAYREHVYHSQREGLSVGQSSSSMSERTGRPVGERTGRIVGPSGQELNVELAQIRTLLDRQREQILADCQAEIKEHEFQANYDRRSTQTISETIESQRVRLQDLIRQLQGHFQDRRVIVQHLLQARLRNGETHCLLKSRNGCKNSKRISWMIEFLNAETHAPVPLMNFLDQSRIHQF